VLLPNRPHIAGSFAPEEREKRRRRLRVAREDEEEESNDDEDDDEGGRMTGLMPSLRRMMS
jgi:hypothetical protein